MKLIIILIMSFFPTLLLAKDKKVFFVSPTENAVLTSPFKVKMGVKGMKVCEANKETKNKKCGHHHILVNQKPIPKGQPIPKDDNHIHFGKLQTETELTLMPGRYTLTLQFADYAHLSYGEELSATINVEVK